jgi:hypothetical protein
MSSSAVISAGFYDRVMETAISPRKSDAKKVRRGNSQISATFAHFPMGGG